MTHRSDYRAQVAQAVASAPELAGASRISAWADAVNADQLPAWFVATPNEVPQRSSHGTSERGTDLIVGLKRLGGEDIEDVLDADAEVLERLVIATLRTRERDCELRSINTRQDGGAEQRVGTLTLTFRVTAWRPDPALS